MNLTWLGHAAFHLETGEGKHFRIDPWLANAKVRVLKLSPGEALSALP